MAAKGSEPELAGVLALLDVSEFLGQPVFEPEESEAFLTYPCFPGIGEDLNRRLHRRKISLASAK